MIKKNLTNIKIKKEKKNNQILMTGYSSKFDFHFHLS